ncbi:uncharacterized protein TNCV_2890401 [Trichonephila clavipes]|nr:uncharacterized protein TNCV_2890401 [Trichonephila clavipes]
MHLQARKGTVDGYEWRCRNQSKDNRLDVVRSVRKGTWFSESKLAKTIILRLTRYWFGKSMNAFVVNDLKVNKKGIKGQFDSYLAEYMWRRSNGHKLVDENFHKFLASIARVYAPTDHDEMQACLNLECGRLPTLDQLLELWSISPWKQQTPPEQIYDELAALQSVFPSLKLEGYSGKMEVAGALSIFQRSQFLYNVRYTKYLGDGDSKAFTSIVENKVYGEHCSVEKLECIGHVMKRMGG